jgi:hypothetical protein
MDPFSLDRMAAAFGGDAEPTRARWSDEVEPSADPAHLAVPDAAPDVTPSAP